MNIEYFVVAVLVLGVLIFVHELGHFLLAKYNGVGVVEFAIGFGRKIWKRQYGETTYSIGIIPLGGYVRMVGDDPRELDSGKSEPVPLTPEEPEISEQERLLRADRSRWFLNKGFFAKSAIVIAGPGFNLLFAVLLSIVSFYCYGKLVAVDTAVIGDVIPNYPAEKAGVRSKDLVVAVDGKPVASWVDLSTAVRVSDGKEVVFEIERPNPAGGAPERLSFKIAATDDTSELSVIEGTGSKRSVKIGIVPDSIRKGVSFSEAVSQGVDHVYTLCVVTVRGLSGMIRGVISPKHISGPIFIFKEAAKSAKKGLEHLLDFMTFLSVSLAILNLLPIPILDGGHLLFFVIQAIRGGKPVSLRVQEVANQVGMLLLLLLMIFAFGNDLWKL